MKKLQLNKRVIAKLSDAEQSAIIGGDAVTTSLSECTKFICCGPGCEATYDLCASEEACTVSCDYPATCVSFDLCTFPDIYCTPLTSYYKC
ncbi:MAG: class I lanthipeptide [Mucilaginibacter sp.]|uniref:class I lanthipeptide n=1 Tax=Mucilaginibacter sp. TaxID=1882438 RepID=UPI00326723BC